MDWHSKQQLIRSVVRQIDIDLTTVNITFGVRDVTAKPAYKDDPREIPHLSFKRSDTPERSKRGESPYRRMKGATQQK